MTKLIPLAALDEPCPSLLLPDGREVGIRQIDGIGMQLMQVAQDGDASLFWDVAARCLPALTPDEVRAFTLTQARTVVEIACGGAQRVLDALGESAAPTVTTPSAPPCAIPSGS